MNIFREIKMEVIRQITIANLYKPIYNITTHFICSFKSEKHGEEGKKLQKFEYLGNEKSILDEIKIIFHRF